MKISGRCSLVIRGESIDKVEIERNLDIQASRFYKKGQKISEIIGENSNDVWIYEVRVDKFSNIEGALLELVKRAEASKNYIQEIKQKYEIFIACHIISELAQMSFELSNSVLGEIQGLGLGVRFSVLSWGGVE